MFSHTVYEWGLEVIKSVQSVKSEPLTLFMKAVSFLSDPKAYAAVLPIIFLCADEKCGMRLALNVFFTAGCNTAIKNVLKVPRPYIADPSVGLTSVYGYSTPSGHSHISAAMWPYAVYLFSKPTVNCGQTGNGKKRRKFSHTVKVFLGVFIPLLIGFSRVYLGVHYPSDVLLGLILGFLFSAGLILFGSCIELRIRNCARMIKILIAALTVAVLNALSPEDTSMGGAFFGFAVACILLFETGGFCASSGSIVQKMLRVCMCVGLCAPLYIVLKNFFSGMDSAHYQLCRFVHYAAVTFFGGFIVPKLCILLQCAQPAVLKPDAEYGEKAV